MNIRIRFATIDDVDLYFQWVNDEEVRRNSFSSGIIDLATHKKWFEKKLKDPDTTFYLFLLDEIPAGQVRIEKNELETVVSISVDKKFRGEKLGVDFLRSSCKLFLERNPDRMLNAYIKTENTSSLRVFHQAGFRNDSSLLVQGMKSIKLIFP